MNELASEPVVDDQPALPNKKELYRTTIQMAWPTMVESFLVSLTGFVDTIMVSVLGASAIAAIGLTDQPKFIGLATFIAISTAISAITARRKGENDRDSANNLLRKMLVIGTILCIIVCVIMFFGADAILRFAGSQEDTHDLAVSYFRIISVGLIFTTTTLIINAAQRGVGNTRISMLTNTTANLVNVVLNYLLISGNFGFPALGVIGAAIATVLGAAAGCAISIRSAFNPAGFIYFRYKTKVKDQQKDVHAMLDIGGSAFVEQIFLRIGFLAFAITVANLGTYALSAHTIAMKFMSLSFALADGLSIASVALVGRSLGQKNPNLARAYGTSCQRLGFLSSCVFSMVMLLAGRSSFTLFSTDPEVLVYANMLIAMLCVVTYVQIGQIIIIGCLRGSGDTKFTAFTSLISVTLVRPFFSWVLCYPCGLGLTGIWLGLFADQCVRFVLGFNRFRRGKWLEIKV